MLSRDCVFDIKHRLSLRGRWIGYCTAQNQSCDSKNSYFKLKVRGERKEGVPGQSIAVILDYILKQHSIDLIKVKRLQAYIYLLFLCERFV